MMSTKCCFVQNIDDLLFSRGEGMGYRVHIDDLIVVQADRGFAADSICNIRIMKSYYVTYVLCIILSILKRTHHHEVLPFRRFAILS